MMDSIKATPQEIYEILEHQKKLSDMRVKLVSVLDKVNQAINSITVENLELTSGEIEKIEKKEEEEEKKPVIQYNPVQQDQRAEEINQQIIDLDLKFSGYEAETDEELDL